MLSQRFQWGLSTLGCPDLTFEAVSQLAAKYGIRALELRALDGQIDLLKHWRSHPPDVGQWQARLNSRTQRIAVLDTACALFAADRSLQALGEYAEWAERLAVPFLRVFDGGRIGDPPNETELDQATDFLKEWGLLRRRQGWQTQILIETHDAFCDSKNALRWLERLETPPGLVWDVHHTWRHGYESVEDTWIRLNPYVRHIHIKDSVRRADSIEHVIPGLGDLPFDRLFRILERDQFQGVVCLEFEKWWRPEIPPLAQCLDACVALRW